MFLISCFLFSDYILSLWGNTVALDQTVVLVFVLLGRSCHVFVTVTCKTARKPALFLTALIHLFQFYFNFIQGDNSSSVDIHNLRFNFSSWEATVKIVVGTLNLMNVICVSIILVKTGRSHCLCKAPLSLFINFEQVFYLVIFIERFIQRTIAKATLSSVMNIKSRNFLSCNDQKCNTTRSNFGFNDIRRLFLFDKGCRFSQETV